VCSSDLGNDLQSWTTTNIPGVFTNVTKSNDAQAGSYAAKAEVTSFQGAPINASITSGDALNPYFEIDQTISKVMFYYKFSPQVSGEKIFVQISLYGDVFPTDFLGFETVSIDQAASSYTLMSVDMQPTASTPKKIQISIVSIATTVGTYFIIDNVSF